MASDYATEVLLLLMMLTPPLLAPERVPWAASLFRRARNRGLVLSAGPPEGGAGVTANRLGPPTAASPMVAAVPGPAAADEDEEEEDDDDDDDLEDDDDDK